MIYQKLFLEKNKEIEKLKNEIYRLSLSYENQINNLQNIINQKNLELNNLRTQLSNNNPIPIPITQNKFFLMKWCVLISYQQIKMFIMQYRVLKPVLLQK